MDDGWDETATESVKITSPPKAPRGRGFSRGGAQQLPKPNRPSLGGMDGQSNSVGSDAMEWSTDNKPAASNDLYDKPKASNIEDDWGLDEGTESKPAAKDDWGTTATGLDSWGTTCGSDSWGTGGNGRNHSLGGGRGGGGSRGPKTCFKCKEEGHMSRDCPKGGARGCFNCGEEGHMSKDCPNPRKERGGGASKTCFKCQQEGHMSRDCPQSDGRGVGGRKCYNCDGEGHMSRDCPEPKKPRKSNSGGGGSWPSNDNAGDGGSWPSNDNAGGGETDWGFGGNGGGGGSGDKKDGNKKSGSGCRKCGKEGHFARECTEEVLGPDGKPRAPIYVPKELNEEDESLFDTSITSGINFDRYEKIPVNVSGQNPPEPISKFSDLITSSTLKNCIEKSKYRNPTPVQKHAIPIISKKRDMMACAQTGSGKTAAFLLPVIQALFNDKNLPSLYGATPQTPLAVIITPTRELAIQIHTEAFKFCRGSIVLPQLIYGGTSIGFQSSQISKGTHILVATPGRLNDFVEKGKISFSELRYLILDEADRMIDQGFLPDVRRIVSSAGMPSKGNRQTLMFSATFSDQVQRLAKEFLSDDYLFLAVGVVGAANTDVEQNLIKVEKFEKRKKLLEILGSSDIKDRTMIFVETKKTADFLASFLSQSEYKATSIHGDRYQRQREEALADFRTGRMPVLVATSVASRGLDIKDVRHVVNYDLPKEIDDYVHRIGRTGRVGNLGKATSFYDPGNDKELIKSLMKILQDAGQDVPDWVLDEANSSGGFSGGRYATNSSGFGGEDVRKNQQNSFAPFPAPAGDDDEDWG